MSRPILIVSQNEAQRRLLSKSLKSAGFDTIQADDIGLALTMMRFDCIGTTIFDATISAGDRESLEQRMSPIHLVYANWPEGNINANDIVRACVHSARQRGTGRVYSLFESLVVASSRRDSLAKIVGKEISLPIPEVRLDG